MSKTKHSHTQVVIEPKDIAMQELFVTSAVESRKGRVQNNISKTFLLRTYDEYDELLLIRNYFQQRRQTTDDRHTNIKWTYLVDVSAPA